MTRSEIEKMVHDWISIWSAQFSNEIFEILHAETFEDCSSAGRGTSKENFKEGIINFLNAFPDVKTVVEDIVADTENNKIAVRWSASGTNKKQYLGIGPTNKLTYITGIEIIQIDNKQIIKRWGEWDITNHKE